ncbi:MAG TPA: PAS domain S-box protein, partial [Bryobacteraceae bacterium]|nr:PAS domain S-box protein [Bryobacteraceae bacterium]
IGACMVGLDRLFLRVNAAFCRFLGYEEQELLGKYMPEITHPDYRVADHENAVSLEQGKSDLYRADKCYLRKDGTAVWGHVTVRLLRDPSGRPLYFVATVEDITEHRKAAEEHQRLQAQLQQAQKMESIGRLAGGVAHDFNNLLTVINGYSALAMNRLREDPLFETVHEIHKAGEAAAALVRQLLAFSRKQLLCEELVDLNGMVGDMRKMLLPLLGEHIEIVAALASSLDPVLADRHQIEQVLMNLAVNARDAMPQGGVLTIATDGVTCGPFCHQCLGQMRPGRYVRVTVRDTGSGMDAQTREHLFEPFFSTKQPGHGTGLGLATVHGIVLQSGGHIDVESEPGRGAIFRVYLPAADGFPPSPSPQAGVVPADAPHGQETILLVEDQAEVRRFVASALEERGYRVLVASSGEEALSRCAEAPVDLLLTDVVMPRMGGCELAALVQSHQPRAKVLFMSGYSEEILNGQTQGVRGAALIQKPFTPHTLARKIREMLAS